MWRTGQTIFKNQIWPNKWIATCVVIVSFLLCRLAYTLVLNRNWQMLACTTLWLLRIFMLGVCFKNHCEIGKRSPPLFRAIDMLLISSIIEILFATNFLFRFFLIDITQYHTIHQFMIIVVRGAFIVNTNGSLFIFVLHQYVI